MSDRYYILYRSVNPETGASWWSIYNSVGSMWSHEAKAHIVRLRQERPESTPILVKEVSTAEVGE
jgi:hypothetical protein